MIVVLAVGAWGTSRVLASGGPASTDTLEAPPARASTDDVRAPAEEGRLASQRPIDPEGAGVAEVLDLQVRTIVIDPGHGGRDPGAIGRGQLEEKEVALDVALRLRDRLARRGSLDVLMTRDADEAVSLEERVAFANSTNADLFVSIHVNALPDTALAPVETYFFGVDATEQARALAHAENSGSTYSVAEFNAALRRAATAVKLQESRSLAESVQQALVRERAIAPHSRLDWGAKAAPFNVLLYTEAPAVLAEITALTNPSEESRLRTPAYREAVATALERGILTYLRLSPPEPDAR